MKNKICKVASVIIAAAVVFLIFLVFYPVFKVTNAAPSPDSKCGTEAAVCELGQVMTCGDGNGTKKCTVNCEWSRCICKPGYRWEVCNCRKYFIDCDETKKPPHTQPCGECGVQNREIVCDGNGNWTDPVWNACQEPSPCP